MREIKKVIKLYGYEELGKEVQEKILNNELEELIDDYCVYGLLEDMEMKAIELLKKYFGDKAEFLSVHYSLGYCQGDGAMIDFNVNYYNVDIHVKQYGNYTHERSFILVYNGYKDITKNRENKLVEKIVNMNEELADFGYAMIDEGNFKDVALENVKNREYLKNGKIYGGVE